MNKTERKKDILLAIPFLLIIIFGVLMGYFSFIEASEKAGDLDIGEIDKRMISGLDRLNYIKAAESVD